MKIQIKNKFSSPLNIGGDTVQPGRVGDVKKDAFDEWSESKLGIFLLSNDKVKTLSGDEEAKKKADKAAAKAAAADQVRAELEPVIRAEVQGDFATIVSSLEVIVSDLGLKNSDLKDIISDLELRNSDLEVAVSKLEEELTNPDEDPVGGAEEETEDGPFVFDPAKHHVEHRGAGNWFVMELEEKIYGPVSDEEKADFEKQAADFAAAQESE